MKIFLYNKYFQTSGGGEKHAGGIAEILAKKHEVSILHEGKIDSDAIARRLNLDLSNVHFVQLGEASPDIEKEVLDYVRIHRPDLFINSTYLSSLVVDAPHRVALVFFPKYFYTKEPSLLEKIKYQAGSILFREYEKKVRLQDGFSHEENNHGTLGRWSYKRSDILINGSFTYADIFFKDHNHRVIRDVVESIRIHNKALNFLILEDRLRIHFNAEDATGIHLYFNTFKPIEFEENSHDERDLGLYITQVQTDALSLFSRLVVKAWQMDRFRKLLNSFYIKKQIMREYYVYRDFLRKNLILSNSNYTSGWIQRIYGKESLEIRLLYPPVDVEKFNNSRQKLNRIICVGRFFVGGHNKKQMDMIRAFKKMYDQYPEARNYEMDLCGGTHSGKLHQDYVALCRLSAQGYPIRFHLNIPFEELTALYSEAKIFWHGAGMHENQHLHPDKFEHFGITTVEAMASGCIPVVIGVAGQLEIVNHTDNGFLWTSEDELIEYTLKLMRDDDLVKTISDKAVKSAEKFGRESFNNEVENIFSKIVAQSFQEKDRQVQLQSEGNLQSTLSAK